MLVNPFAQLDDAALNQGLERLSANQRSDDADIILHLLVVKERRLFVAAGYDTLANYCLGKWRYSRSTAYRRVAVVEQVEAFPELVDRLRDGRLHLCAAALVARRLEAATAREL